MPNPKIFISHSAKEERTRKILGALYARLRKAGFDVLLDKQRLKPGDQWRDELNRWLWQCHGAVILLSTDALNSPWVLKEATNLTWRRDLSRQFNNLLFDALPVLLPPVTTAQLANTGFSPLAIDEIQMAPTDTDDDLIDKIVDRLAPLRQRLEWSIFKKVQGAMVAILDKISREEALDLMAQSLRIDTTIFGVGGDKKIHLADHALKTGDFGALLEVVRILTPRVGRENAKEFCRIVWPFSWVDQLAASRIPVVMKKPERKRSMVLNSRRKETVEMYIRRICQDYPPWTFKELRGAYSGAQVDEMLDDLRTIIKRHLGYEQADEVSDEELNGDLANDVTERPLVVIVPPPLPDRAAFDQVREAFSQTTYILLSDQIDSIQFRDLNFADVEFLLPELDQGVESKARRDFNKLSDEIERILINAG